MSAGEVAVAAGGLGRLRRPFAAAFARQAGRAAAAGEISEAGFWHSLAVLLAEADAEESASLRELDFCPGVEVVAVELPGAGDGEEVIE